MPLFRIAGESFERVAETTFANERLLERQDLQRLLRSDISVLGQDMMVVTQEFGEWEDSGRRIDLLCLDRQARVVVVELKRTDDGGHMELQAIRYAAMVSGMRLDQLTAAHSRYLGVDHANAQAALLAFLSWDSETDGALSEDVRIVLVSGNFSRELTTAVLWLNKQGLDITCFRLKPHRLGAEILVDIQQLIPLPEAADYETKLKAHRQETQRVQSARHDIYLRFWALLIERSKAHTQVVAGRSPSSDHWLNGATGRAGFAFVFSLKKLTSRVELYIDLGKGTEERTLKAFLALQDRKAEIESVFGEDLVWQDLPETRGCRISSEIQGGWRTAEDAWPELQERLIDSMVRLERAMKPELARLP